MATEEEYEHDLKFSQSWGWAILIGVSALFIAFGMVAMFTIEDPPRQWDFGVIADAPGASIETTREPTPARNRNPPEQIPPLPEGIVWDREKAAAPAESRNTGGP